MLLAPSDDAESPRGGNSLSHIVVTCASVCAEVLRLSPLRSGGLLLALLVSSIASVAAPVVLGTGISLAATSEDPRTVLAFLAVAYSVTWLIGSTARYAAYPLYGRLEQEAQSTFMSRSLLSSLTSTSRDRHNLEASEIGFAIDSEAGAARDILSGVCLAVVPAGVGVVAGVVAIWAASTWHQAVVFLVFLLAYLLVSGPLIRRHQKIQGAFFAENMRSFGVLGNFLGLWREARVFGAANYLRDGFRHDRLTVEAAGVEAYSATRALYTAQGVLLAGALATLILMNAFRSDLGVESIVGSTVAVAGVCVSAISPLQSVGFGISSIAVAVAHIDESSAKIRLESEQDSRARSCGASVRRVSDGSPELVVRGSSDGKAIPLQFGHPVWFIGASGSGKTTSLEEILGLRGDAGGSLPGDAGRAYLPQESGLLNANGARNVLFGRDLPLNRVDELFDMLGLGEFGSSGVRADDDVAGEHGGASGGEARRIALARAIAGHERLIVLDEPTSGLDGQSRAEVWRAIRSVSEDRYLVIATHDPDAPIDEGDPIVRF